MLTHALSALLAALLLLSGCSTSLPEGIQPVTPFDLSRYEGKWYEIARLDHSFERGLTDVHAVYSRREDGSVRVLNRGYDLEKKAWREAEGKAVFIGEPNVGSLKVSFFGPFYGGYHIMALDQRDYRWSMVIGADRDYLWILARQPVLPGEIKQQLLQQSEKAGINTQRLIWVSHTRSDSQARESSS